jgi:uncharacterized membrane protein YraQ (UPF0718 family)
MGIPDGAHTHGGGSGPGELVVILLAVALLGPAVAAAVAELLHLLVIVIMVLAALRAAGLAGLLVLRARRRLESAARAVAPNLGAVSPLHETERALRRCRGHRDHLSCRSNLDVKCPAGFHLHVHGVNAEDVAALLAWDLPQPDVNRQEPPHVP